MTSSMELTSPLDYQVIQRRSLHDGVIPVAGSCNPPCERVEVRFSGRTMDGSRHASPWLAAELAPASGGNGFRALLWHQGENDADTAAMTGDLRDCDGTGIHFSKTGLMAHGEAWAAKVAAWLDPRLTSDHTNTPP